MIDQIDEWDKITRYISEEIAKVREEVLYRTFNLHVRALACHCECLGMNSENSWRVCCNEVIAYTDEHYLKTMQKWGLMNEKGEPLI